MKNVLIFSMAAVSMLSATDDKNVNEIAVSGMVRAAYVSQNNVLENDTVATVMGGKIKLESPDLNGFKTAVAGYGAVRFPFASGSGDELNYDMLSSRYGSYAYIGEAYVEYASDGFALRIGRQLFDSPFADTDDIRMFPNTFEAAVATYELNEKTVVYGGYITRWSGYDSGEDITDFKRVATGSSGTALVGITNEALAHTAIQAWGYHMDKLTDAFYIDGTYRSDYQTDFSLQYAHFHPLNDDAGVSTGIGGNVYGASLNAAGEIFNAGIALNRACNPQGQSVINGLGGGPYFTSMEEMTIDGMEDAKAWSVTVGAQLNALGADGLSITAGFGVFKSDPMELNVREFDMIAAYEVGENITADVSYAKIDDRNNNFEDGSDGGYSRFLARINYNF